MTENPSTSVAPTSVPAVNEEMESPEEEIEGDNNVRCSVELVDDAADNDHEIDNEVITDSELIALLEAEEMEYPIDKLNKNNERICRKFGRKVRKILHRISILQKMKEN